MPGSAEEMFWVRGDLLDVGVAGVGFAIRGSARGTY